MGCDLELEIRKKFGNRLSHLCIDRNVQYRGKILLGVGIKVDDDHWGSLYSQDELPNNIIHSLTRWADREKAAA